VNLIFHLLRAFKVIFSLIDSVESIRSTYKDDWKSKEMKVRQRAVALYFIDKVPFYSSSNNVKPSLN